VYFPETAVVSLVNSLSDGRMVETATVGRDGMAGLPAFLQAGAPSPQAFVHVPGSARRMDATTFRRMSGAPGPLHDVMLSYTLTFLTQVAQTAACNGSHLLEERCARWLLMTAERAGVRAFPLTHDFLSFMLGVRRAGVTNAMRSLQDRHLIRYVRGRIEILDDVGLERASCECYGTMRARAHLRAVLV
jgi:CRP-like cAMP-binding protein